MVSDRATGRAAVENARHRYVGLKVPVSLIREVRCGETDHVQIEAGTLV